MPEPSVTDNDDVENMKSANIDSDETNNASASEKSDPESKAPHTDDEFNKFFKK